MTEETKKDEAPKEPSKIVTGQDMRPCGCIEREFGDGRKEIIPCPPHALLAAAQNMMQAGNALGAAAQRLLQDAQMQAQAAFEQAVSSVAQGKGGGGIIKP